MSGRKIRVEVVYALPQRQRLVRLSLAEGGTARDAIEASGVCREFPEIDLSRNRIGVYGRVAGLETKLGEGDRVEIYRPLQADPKEVRRKRARKSGARS